MPLEQTFSCWSGKASPDRTLPTDACTKAGLTYCLCRISCEINFFIIKVGIESCSVNRYNCRLRGEIRVLVAIETDSSHRLFPCKLRKENNPLRGRGRGRAAPGAGSDLRRMAPSLLGCGWTVSASPHMSLMVFSSFLVCLLSPNLNIMLSFICVFKTQLMLVDRARL